MEKKKYNVYYAHHRWKYGTKVEEYELDLINRHFPNAVIFNPSKELELTVPMHEYTRYKTEEEIMGECFQAVDDSEIVIFSSMDGMIGKGVYKEIQRALLDNKLVLYIYHNTLITNWDLVWPSTSDKDRLYVGIEVK